YLLLLFRLDTLSTLFPYTVLFRSLIPAYPNFPQPSPAGPARAPARPRPSRPAARRLLRPALLRRRPACRSRRQPAASSGPTRYKSAEHTSELQARENIACRLLPVQ